MGIELRFVDSDWEHPKLKGHPDGYQPMFDEDFENAISKWIEEYTLWKSGMYPNQREHVAYMKLGELYGYQTEEFEEAYKLFSAGRHPDQEELMKPEDYIYEYPFWKCTDFPPNPRFYRLKPFKKPSWYQIYENVTEGTPISPKFATKEDLVEYLVSQGTFWDQKRGGGGWEREEAENFVK